MAVTTRDEDEKSVGREAPVPKIRMDRRVERALLGKITQLLDAHITGCGRHEDLYRAEMHGLAKLLDIKYEIDEDED